MSDHHPLGQWAVIDIETTGADALYDQIIDLGYLQFDGLTLVRKYDSLVKSEVELSHFIQKLTGITPKMLKNAPTFYEVKQDLLDLYGSHLLAHNADFEESFFKEHFDKIDDGTGREQYEDSLYYLAMLFPHYSSLKLENFIVEWELAEKELHRGYQDSLDLLKVILIATRVAQMDRARETTLHSLFQKYNLTDYWYYKFFCLSLDELNQIASQIDFDLHKHALIAKNKMDEKQEPIDVGEKLFSFDFTGQNIRSIYQEEKKIQTKMENFRYRESQEELSLRVGQAFKNKVHALVQAPTGTGKTLGYLVPSTLHALENNKQVLVATGTKTLQNQAMKKDVPQVRKLLGLNDEELKIRQLVGSGNHLCELLFRQSVEEEDLFNVNKTFFDKFTDLYYDMVFFHNATRGVDHQIMRGDLPYVFKRKGEVFAQRDQDIAVDFRACTGKSCPFKNDCSYIKGLREAKDANIIIGNHALMFSWPKSFPRPEYIVVDEAHKIEGETTSACTYEVSLKDLEGLSKSIVHLQGLGSLFYLLAQYEESEGSSTEIINHIRNEAQGLQRMLSDHLFGLPDKVEMFFKKMPRYTSEYWNELPMIRKGSSDQLGMGIYNHLDSIRHIITELTKLMMPYSVKWEASNLKNDNEIIALTRFEAFFGHVQDIQTALEFGLGFPDLRTDYTHSIRYHEAFGFLMNSAPINVGRVLHDSLLETSASVVFTSATLGNAHGDQGVRGIEWATGYTYCSPERRFKGGFYLPAIYDYENKTRVFLCDDTPTLYSHDFIDKTLGPICELIKNLGGRSLLLYSAKTRFEKAREYLLSKFEGQIPVFVQGMGNNVVEEFKDSGNGILLGMESFGEGIDVPGEALQFVFIDKVPDLRMDLVIRDRREFYEANIGNEFTDYYLSHRTRSLHQKLGRLLRTEKDFGGVIIVDSRTRSWKGRTMEKVLKLMEPYKVVRTSLDQACKGVEEFVKN
ncbi:helicase C-terminal domain-containing protein [Halobacteriovorax sp. GB3]|uniref:helicase C-terminal domain-containing protein n=1 Tax=Halobacteriovorax sp. GB3 TaxID=2719615 RepID=UPI00235EFC93|nr:helicase C-terminal domain-containing protein [Halobacteriovorax sp. GB3]MDD0853556.1 helicase C-terminal domain-containing protein [Halobacteriovorax sp. GB3]